MTSNQINSPPEDLRSPLSQLRDYYATLVTDYEHKATVARLQLIRIEALLSNWTSESEASNHQLTATPAIESLVDQNEQLLDIAFPNEDNLDKDTAVVESAIAPENSPTSVSPDNDSHKVMEVPMLPQYQGTNRTIAIEKLLQEHKGTVCHIDFVVRSLYGDLEPKVFKVVKGRVQSSLTHGKERNLWAAVPDAPGCYTLDLNLVESKNSNGAKKVKRSSKATPALPKAERVPMLPEFAGQFLIDAIAVLFKQNAGKIFSVDQVITGIYGVVDEPELKDIKNAVHNELSRGHRIGRFFRVPDKNGFYTWDLNAVQNANTSNLAAS